MKNKTFTAMPKCSVEASLGESGLYLFEHDEQNKCLTFCIGETPKRVLSQTVKTKMKFSIMLHFIWVYTVCKGRKDFQTKEYNIF